MTDDRFFALVGRAMTLFALAVCCVLIGYALHALYDTDQRDCTLLPPGAAVTTPVIAPLQKKAP